MTQLRSRPNRVSVELEELELAKELSREALDLLLRATYYARNSARPIWDFAVELHQLMQSGFSWSDLRWLACKGYVKHAIESSRDYGERRTFAQVSTLAFGDRSSFILTETGSRFAEVMISKTPTANGVGPHSGCTPSWDRLKRELSLGVTIIKRYCVPARNQEIILSAFQEEAWPSHIDDPLPPVAGLDIKRRLHSTIQCLNRNQRVRLLHFHGDGYGRGVCWETA
jgi:hypothetical protein